MNPDAHITHDCSAMAPAAQPFTTLTATVGDYYATDYAALWVDLPDTTTVVAAHDPATGLYCALAIAEGQSVEQCGLEARVRLAGYIAGQRMAA